MKTTCFLHLYCAVWPNLINKGRKERAIDGCFVKKRPINAADVDRKFMSYRESRIKCK